MQVSAIKPFKPPKPSPSAGGSPLRFIPTVLNPWPMDKRLLQLWGGDWYTVGHSFEGTLALGQSGSGKTTGPGRAIAISMLMAGYGGLVLTTKPQDASDFFQLAKLAGRERDIRVVSPHGPWKLSILDYTFKVSGGRSDAVVNLVLEWLQARDRSRGTPADPFWVDSCRVMLTCAIDLIGLAGDTITFANIARLIGSAAQSPEEVRSKEWQKESYLNDLVTRATSRKDLTGAQNNDLNVAVFYWLHDYVTTDEKTRSGVRATAKSITFPFERNLLATLFGGESNLFPEDCYRSGAIIIIDVPVKEYLEVGTGAQILFKTVWQRAMERRDVNSFPRPVFLWIDEYQNFVTPYDPLFLATARSSKCATVILTQNLDSIVSRFPAQTGKAEAQALLGNFNLKIFCAQDHVGTNEWAAKMIGETWITRQNVSTTLGPEGNMTAGTNEQRRFLLDPITFMRLLKGGRDNAGKVQAVLFRSGRPFSNGQNHIRVDFNQNLT